MKDGGNNRLGEIVAGHLVGITDQVAMAEAFDTLTVHIVVATINRQISRGIEIGRTEIAVIQSAFDLLGCPRRPGVAVEITDVTPTARALRNAPLQGGAGRPHIPFGAKITPWNLSAHGTSPT